MAEPGPVRRACARFDESFHDRAGDVSEHLLPSRLARAATTALGVDGASLTVRVAELRVPLGASSAEAALAESLQFTEGDGQRSRGMRRGERVGVPTADLDHRWHLLATRWREQTPYRSALSAPVPVDGVSASVDLYMTCARDGDEFAPGTVEAVAELVGARLGDEFASPPGEHTMSRRAEVWTAIGMVMGETGGAPAASLGRLRSFAAARGDLLDELAHRMVVGTVPVGAVARSVG